MRLRNLSPECPADFPKPWQDINYWTKEALRNLDWLAYYLADTEAQRSQGSYEEWKPAPGMFNDSDPDAKPSQITEFLRWAVFERDNFTCKKCGSRSRLTADHILAESKGGEATMENLQTLCRSCNSRKGAK